MLQIKEITEGEYVTYKSFMDSLLNAIDVIINPHMFLVDGVNYAVCKEGPVIAVSEQLSDGNHTSYAVLMDDTGEKVERIVDEYSLLEIFLENEIPIVSRTDLVTKKLEQFFITWAQENQPHDYLHYYVCNDDESAEMEYQFDITHFKSYLASWLYYIEHKNPDLITINYLKGLKSVLGKKTKDSYIKKSSEEGYGKVLFEVGGQTAVITGRTFTLEELKSFIESLDINSKIPEDLIQTYLGKNEKVKTLELIGKEYNKIIGFKGGNPLNL